MTIPRDTMVDRVIAQTEWYPTRPWAYTEAEAAAGGRNGTAQALRFVAAQTFMISWQRGKVPVGWTRPRKFKDFQTVYGDDVVAAAKAEIERRKVQQRDIEARRVADLIKTKSGSRRDIGDPTDPIQEGVQSGIRKGMHMTIRSKFTQTSIPMKPYYDDDDDHLLPLPAIPGAQQSAQNHSDGPTDKDGSAPLESVADIKGKSKAWIAAMQRKEEEAKRRKEEAAEKERQEKEQDEANIKKLEDERARRMQRSAAFDMARKTSRQPDTTTPTGSGALDNVSGPLPLSRLASRAVSKPSAPQVNEQQDDSVPEWIRLRNEKMKADEAKNEPKIAPQPEAQTEAKDNGVPDWIRLRSSKMATSANSSPPPTNEPDETTPEFMKRAQAFKSTSPTDPAPLNVISPMASKSTETQSSPAKTDVDDGQPEWMRKAHALQSSKHSQIEDRSSGPAVPVGKAESIFNDKTVADNSEPIEVEEVEEVEEEEEEGESESVEAAAVAEENKWTSQLKKTKSNYVAGMRINTPPSEEEIQAQSTNENESENSPAANPWAAALKKTKSNYVAGVRLEKPELSSSDSQDNKDQQVPEPTSWAASLKKTRADDAEIGQKGLVSNGELDTSEKAKPSAGNPWAGVLRTNDPDNLTPRSRARAVRIQTSEPTETTGQLSSLKKTKSTYQGARMGDTDASKEASATVEAMDTLPTEARSAAAHNNEPVLARVSPKNDSWAKKNDSWAAEMRRSGIKVEEAETVEVEESGDTLKGNTPNSISLASKVNITEEVLSLKGCIKELELSLTSVKQRLADLEGHGKDN